VFGQSAVLPARTVQRAARFFSIFPEKDTVGLSDPWASQTGHVLDAPSMKTRCSLYVTLRHHDGVGARGAHSRVARAERVMSTLAAHPPCLLRSALTRHAARPTNFPKKDSAKLVPTSLDELQVRSNVAPGNQWRRHALGHLRSRCHVRLA